MRFSVQPPTSVAGRGVSAVNLTGLSRSSRVLSYTLQGACRVSARLYDLRGRVVWSMSSHEAAGSHAVSLRAIATPQGRYVLRFEAGDLRVTRSVTLMQ